MAAIGRAFSPTRRGRRAVTLLELLLTLSLLVALMALAWPALDGPLARQRLLSAADQIRSKWGQARVQAMSSGQTYLFRCVVDSDRYMIECRSGPEFVADAIAAEGPDGFAAETYESAATQKTEYRLPESVTFVAGEASQDARANAINYGTDSPSGVQEDWSEAILFYPDGTTSTARLVLKNHRDYCIELSLRGLTGAMSVGDSYSAEE